MDSPATGRPTEAATLTSDALDADADATFSSYTCLPDGDGCPVYSFVTQTLFVGFFCLVGLFGNSVSWYVFFKTNVKSSTLFLFQSLSVVDNLLLLTVFPVFCLEPFVRFSGLFQDYLDCGYKFLVHVIFFPWASVNQTATVWLTVLVGLNRYVAVCRPYQTGKLSSIHQSKIQLAIVLVFSLLYNIPKFFETYPVSRDSILDRMNADLNSYNSSSSDNSTGDDVYNVSSVIRQGSGRSGGKKCWCLAFSSYYMNETYIHGYESVMYTIFLLILPLSTLAILNILLIRQLKKLKKRRSEMQSVRQQHDNNVTLVLIIVVLVFIVCQSPALVNRVMWSLYEDTKRTCPGFQYYFSRLSNLMVVANSSVNFFIYYLFNLRFRQVLSQTVCSLPFRRCVKKNPGYSNVAGHQHHHRQQHNAGPGCSLAPLTNRVSAHEESPAGPMVVENQNVVPCSVNLTQGMALVTRKKPQQPVETKFVSNFRDVTQYKDVGGELSRDKMAADERGQRVRRDSQQLDGV